jgi:Fic family protein
MSFNISYIPTDSMLESRVVLKKAAEAHRYLAELKGISASIPNQAILIDTLSIQEAKDSSEIENIITTHDAYFKRDLFPDISKNLAAKEVLNYVAALKVGFKLVQKEKVLSMNHILKIQSVLEDNNAGIRKIPGTELRNDRTGETVYTPPQDYNEIIALFRKLEDYINSKSDVDPLIRMAVIHLQFESIHPFYDGNGRTGRIINVLFLVLQNLLSIPILYLSRYIVGTKEQYYTLLQSVRDKNTWEDWLVYILEGVKQTAIQTIEKVKVISETMMEYKHRIRNEIKFYSQDLINHLFRHPYTKIEYMEQTLKISRITAMKYLKELVDKKYLTKHKISRSNYYVNERLFSILTD